MHDAVDSDAGVEVEAGPDAGGLTRRRVMQATALGVGGMALASGTAQAHSSTSKKGRIDLHTHFFPQFWIDVLTARGLWPVPGLPITWSVEEHLAFMDQFGIQMGIANIADPGPFAGDQAQANGLARQFNEFAAGLIAQYPKRFGFFAAVPLPGVADTLAEIAYALDTLKLDGVGVQSHINGVYLGDPSYNPVLAELNRRKATVFIHPSVPAKGSTFPGPPQAGGLPPFLFDYPFDTTRALVNLLFRGAMTAFPDIKWIAAHAGGTVPFLDRRLDSAAYLNPAWSPGGPLLPEGLLTYLGRQVWYDTALSASVEQMVATRELAGKEHITFGSDWPPANVLYSGALAGKTVLAAKGNDPAPGLNKVFGSASRRKIDRENALALVPTAAARLAAP